MVNVQSVLLDAFPGERMEVHLPQATEIVGAKMTVWGRRPLHLGEDFMLDVQGAYELVTPQGLEHTILIYNVVDSNRIPWVCPQTELMAEMFVTYLEN